MDYAGKTVYEIPENTFSETYFISFFLGILDNWETDFNRQINYWIEIKLSEQITTFVVFSFREGSVIRLLENEQILEATAITPEKLVLQLAANKDNPFGRMKICMYDIIKNECIKLLDDVPYKKEPFSGHRAFGTVHLFSVWIKEIVDEIHDYHHSIFLLYNPEGQQLVDFETTIGQNGENTCFEPSRKGRGITYKKLNNPISLSSGRYHSSDGICNVQKEIVMVILITSQDKYPIILVKALQDTQSILIKNIMPFITQRRLPAISFDDSE